MSNSAASGVAHRRRELLQRRDVVRDPDAAAVGRDDQIVVARMDQDVVGAHRRELFMNFCHFLPPSSEMNSPNSVPT